MILGNVMGIHYTFGANRAAKKMEKQAKREKKLADRRAKKSSKKSGLIRQKEETKMHDISKTITLDDLTNPDKK